jgi:uncharacterized membrane protein
MRQICRIAIKGNQVVGPKRTLLLAYTRGMKRTAHQQFLFALAGPALVSLLFFAVGALRNHNLEFSYLVWNLFLAWLPLAFAIRLTKVLKTKLWSSWEGLFYSVLWLVFLPNSFYMISDFIHLQDVMRVDLLYDAVMFTSFIFSGVIVGISSLYLVHLQFLRRFNRREVNGLMAGTLLICSFAIYVGRDLRWNSWDILTNPGGLLFDVSDRLTHPASYPAMFTTVISFFVLLATMYYTVWRSSQLVRKDV